MSLRQNVFSCTLTSFVLLLCSQVALCLPSPLGGPPPLPTVVISAGTLVGTTTSLSAPSASMTVNKFLGIKYASVTSRFSTASPLPSGTQKTTVTTTSSVCWQATIPPPTPTGVFSPYIFPAALQDEDCLYLNVFAPADAVTNGNKTVMMWIHGGSLRDGYGMDPTFDGSAFATFQDVIVVTINYRLNVFGFPNFNIPSNTIANLGIDDQRQAMTWIQKNIGHFGGNKNSVTIFGESAGAWSVDIHLNAYSSNPPFRAAILESSQVSIGPPNMQNLASWQSLVNSLKNCSSITTNSAQITCVQSWSAAAIQVRVAALGIAVPFPSYPDGITEVAGQINAAGVPVLLGTNANEYRALTDPTSYTSAGAFANYVSTLVGRLSLSPSSSYSLSTSITSALPTGSPAASAIPGYNTDYDRVAQLNTLAILQCPMSYLANDMATGNGTTAVPVWRYYYNASFPNWEPIVPTIPGGLEVFHSSEIIEVFDTFPGGPVNNALLSAPQASTNSFPTSVPPAPTQSGLGNLMNFYWANFAKSPGSGPATASSHWPSITASPTVPQIAVLATSPFLAAATSLDTVCTTIAPLTAICGAQAGCSG